MIHAEAIVEDARTEDDREANARIFFQLDVQNLRHMADVQITVEGDESARGTLGLCWLQEDYLGRSPS
jgi:hypothetical protein